MKPNTTLMVSISACYSECNCCSKILAKDYSPFLSPSILMKFKDVLNDFLFDEAITLCPIIQDYFRFVELLRIIKGISKRNILFIPAVSVNSFRFKDIVNIVDELVIVSCNVEELVKCNMFVESLQSLGFEDISLYWVLNSLNAHSTLAVIDYCMRRQIKLRVGPALYNSYSEVDIDKTLTSLGIRIGCVYGYLYGHLAKKAYYNEFPITILTRPCNTSYPCRRLFIHPLGLLKKCPLQSDKGKYIGQAKVTDITKIIYSECKPRKHSMPRLTPKIIIGMIVRDDVAIDEKSLELLEIIDYTKSIRSASLVLGIHPSTAIKKLRELETKLGLRLVKTRRGGQDRGRTELTSEGKEVVNLYRRIKKNIMKVLSEEQNTLQP